MTTPQTIALIHGYGFDYRIWSPVEIAFDGFNVVPLMLPGFGNEDIHGPYSITQLARQYWKDLDAMGEETVHLIGHSMGGYVCMEMVAQRPEGVLSLTLMHSHVFADSEEKKKARTETLAEIQSSGKDAFVRRMISGMIADKEKFSLVVEALIARGLEYDDEAWYNGTQAIRDRTDHAATLQAMTAPVMFIMGEADKAVPVELAYKQSPMAQHSRLHVYKGVGHLSMYEYTSQLIIDLMSFYASMKT